MKFSGKFRLGRSQIVGGLIIASSVGLAYAATLTIPNTFTSGTPAVAADVNANFSAVATAVNSNRPLIKQSATSVDVPVTSTVAPPTHIVSITVTPPADGYVLVTASGSLGINQTVPANNFQHISISTSTTTYDANHESFHAFDTRNGSAGRSWVPLHVDRMQAVTAKVPVTFALTAVRDDTGSNQLYAKGRLTVMFVPDALP